MTLMYDHGYRYVHSGLFAYDDVHTTLPFYVRTMEYANECSM